MQKEYNKSIMSLKINGKNYHRTKILLIDEVFENKLEYCYTFLCHNDGSGLNIYTFLIKAHITYAFLNTYHLIPFLNPSLISNQIKSRFNCTYKTFTYLLPDVINILFNNKMIYD